MKKILYVLFAAFLVLGLTGCNLFPTGPVDPTDPPEEALHNSAHCLCSGTADGVGEHTCLTVEGWTEVRTADELIAAIDGSATAPAYVYLGASITVEGGLFVPSGADVTICLGGKTITADTVNYGYLNITDCQNNTGVWTSNSSYTVRTLAQGVTNLYAGKMTSNGATEDAQVMVVDGEKYDEMPGGIATLNMYGGIIESTHKTTNPGSNVSLLYKGVFYMYDGLITGGYVRANDTVPQIPSGSKTTADKFGGNVALKRDGAEMYMYGGEISDGYICFFNADGGMEKGTSGAWGGNIGVWNGKLYIYGGTVADGEAVGNGGNIGMGSYGNIHIEGCTITGGVSSNFGGNFYISGGSQAEVYFKNATIEYGDAVGGGGNIFVQALAKGFTLEDCSVTDGFCTNEISGGIGLQGTTFTVTLKGSNYFADNYGCDIHLRHRNGLEGYARLSVSGATAAENPILLAAGKHAYQVTIDAPQVALDTLFAAADGSKIAIREVEVEGGAMNALFVSPSSLNFDWEVTAEPETPAEPAA